MGLENKHLAHSNNTDPKVVVGPLDLKSKQQQAKSEMQVAKALHTHARASNGEIAKSQS